MVVTVDPSTAVVITTMCLLCPSCRKALVFDVVGTLVMGLVDVIMVFVVLPDSDGTGVGLGWSGTSAV